MPHASHASLPKAAKLTNFGRKPWTFGLALGLCALAFVAGSLLGAPASSFMLAVMAASLIGGRRTAQLTIVVCVCLFVFYAPRPTPLWPMHRGLFRIILFLITSFLTVGILEARARAQKLQLQSGRDFQAVADTSPDCILFVDPGRIILFANPAVGHLFGIPQQEIVGKHITALLPDLQDHQEPQGEFSFRFATGSEFTIEATCGKFADKTTLFLRNISDRKRAEDSRRTFEISLRRTESKLAEAAQIATASELAASIVHEISQPLSAMVVNGQACLRWLQDQPPSLPEGQAAAERIVRNGREVGLIVSGLRSLFSHVALQKADLSMRDIADEVILLTRSKAQRAGVEIENVISGSLPAVYGDKTQLQQVFLNLVLNAIEATQDASLSYKVITIRAVEEQEGLVTSVEDQGAGAADYEEIFRAFVSTKSRGMGMGLAISNSIVEAHRGRLWGSRGNPNGSVFSCLLPYATKENSNEQRSDDLSPR